MRDFYIFFAKLLTINNLVKIPSVFCLNYVNLVNPLINQKEIMVKKVYVIIASNSSSLMMGILSLVAFSSLAGPILSPATR
jgi:hypothetical protein